MTITLLLLAVLAAVTGMLVREGLWRSLLMFFNVLVAATLATGWYEALAGLLEKYLADYTYLLDFLCMWLIFCVVLSLAREATDRMSRRAVVFPQLVERIGGALLALATGWLVMAFTAATLHTAPVPRDVIQPTPEARLFLGLAPDRKWLSWVRSSSLAGPFSRSTAAFDKDAEFILRYADRRLKLEQAERLRVPTK
jgi:uncharacterized membrane protein required for colicin V production